MYTKEESDDQNCRNKILKIQQNLETSADAFIGEQRKCPIRMTIKKGMLNIPIKMELCTHTSLIVACFIDFVRDVKMLSSSSITTHASHFPIDSRNLSLNLAAA